MKKLLELERNRSAQWRTNIKLDREHAHLGIVTFGQNWSQLYHRNKDYLLLSNEEESSEDQEEIEDLEELQDNFQDEFHGKPEDKGKRNGKSHRPGPQSGSESQSSPRRR